VGYNAKRHNISEDGSSKLDMGLNADKCKVTVIRGWNDRSDITVVGSRIEVVDKFFYLG